MEETRQGHGGSFEVVYRCHQAVVLTFLVMAETFAGLLVLVRDPSRELPPVPLA